MQRLENTVSKVSHFKAVTVDFSIKITQWNLKGDVYCLSVRKQSENKGPKSEVFSHRLCCKGCNISPREFPVWSEQKQCLCMIVNV